MAKIFISYAHDDKSIVLEIYNALKSKGFPLWIDIEDLLPGQNWKTEIAKAIRESDVFIACLSSNSVNKKGFVQAELKGALEVAQEIPESEIFIIPVRLDNCEAPDSLKKWHWLNYSDTNWEEKLFRAIQTRVKTAANNIEEHTVHISTTHTIHNNSLSIEDERFFDAGDRVKTVRNELGLETSEFAELLDVYSQRKYESMESRTSEFPLSILKKISDISGVDLEWLKHGRGQRYEIDVIDLHPIEDDLERCANLNPQEYFLTIDKKQLHVGLIVQISKYRYQVMETGVTLDFWNWAESHWAISAFYHFLEKLSDLGHNIRGISIPPHYDKQLFKGEIHFLAACRNEDSLPAGNLLYDLLDLDRTRQGSFPYSKTYGGNWMDRVHDYFKEYLEKEKARSKVDKKSICEQTSNSINLEEEFKQVLKGTYDAARKRGYVATYFLQMLEEHGGVETAKRLLAKSEPQAGLFELWNLGLLHESMEAVIWDNARFHQFFTPQEIEEAHRRLEELGYFNKKK